MKSVTDFFEQNGIGYFETIEEEDNLDNYYINTEDMELLDKDESDENCA
jgi:hypothetical protein